MKMLGTKTIETDRLILRKFTIDDAEQVFKNYGSDPLVNKYLNWKTHKSIEDAKESVRYFMKDYPDNGFHWAVVLKDTNEIMEAMACNKVDKKNNYLEISDQ